MTASFPFLTSYDPPASSEGTLDPLGLYQIADQLAVQLVPAVRERMRRIRFLTAMTVGALVTEDLEDDQRHRDASPYLVWEWLVVESIVREVEDRAELAAVPGRDMARRAIDQRGCLDARSYLKVPRIFGFHGIYKRLAVHLDLLNVHLGPGPNAERLANAWAHGQGLSNFAGTKALLTKWRTAVRRSLDEKPPQAKPGWTNESWRQLANAFTPGSARSRERQVLTDLLLASTGKTLGAFSTIWKLQEDFVDDDEFREEDLHNRLEERQPAYAALLNAIREYESFARRLQDAFDVLRAEAARPDARGFVISEIGREKDFKSSVSGLHKRFESAYKALGEVTIASVSTQSLFSERFKAFAEPMDAQTCAKALCSHHEDIQKRKSADGKRPWFDRISPDRIYMRHAYRIPRRSPQSNRYLHEYRGRPIGRFRLDLAS
jgi:hypothetical protein